MKIIDGKKISNKILVNLKKEIKKLKLKPTLAVILIGNDKASHLYVNIKEKRAAQIGIGFKKYLFSKNVSPTTILDLINHLNSDKNITAFLVQLPLPKHLNSDKIISTISPQKDADGIHPKNLKLLKKGKKVKILPATTSAVIEALKFTKINLKNKSVAIIGKSKIVGLPTYYYLKQQVKTINIYDSTTKKLAAKTSRADILIVAIGQPNFISADYIKQGAIIIDVGINKVNNHTVGDVNFAKVKKTAEYITPVPGGIGPITVSALLNNVIKLSKN